MEGVGVSPLAWGDCNWWGELRTPGTRGPCHGHGHAGERQHSQSRLQGEPAGFRAEKELNPAVVL